MEYLYLKIVTIAFTFAFFIVFFFAYNNKVLSLKGYDVVSKAGEKIFIKCKLETSDILGFSKSGEKINFFLDGTCIGSNVTNSQGYAQIEYQFENFSVNQITMKLDRKSLFLANTGKIIAGVFDNNKPILICDIDHTVCDTKLVLFFFRKDTAVPTVKGSVESLIRIAKNYNIIYVTHRDEAIMHRTKKWLEANCYPQGPVFFWEFGHLPFSNEKYKMMIVKSLKERFPNIAAGIGDKRGDIMAYVTNNVSGILFSKSKKNNLPEDVYQASEWTEIENYLLRLRGNN